MPVSDQASAPTHPGSPGNHARVLVALICATWAALFLIRLFGQPNILDDDQERPAMYIQDLLVNHHVLVQWDADGDIMSKPPMYTWYCVTLAKVMGGFNETSLYLAGALAVLATALLIFFHGRRYFGDTGAFFGAAMLLLSNPSIKLVHLARTDGLFMLLVYTTAILALEAYRGRCSWYWFWFAAALATLTKGPLGLVLAAGGLISLCFSRDESRIKRAILIPNILGFGVFTLICGGWFWAAYNYAGEPLIAKLIGKELVGHAVEGGRGDMIGSKIHQPILYFLSRFGPWSVVTFYAVYRAFKERKRYSPQSFAYIFLSCYFVFGMILFSLSPHQRFDHQFPLIPAAGLLAGEQIAQWLGEFRSRRVVSFFPMGAALVLLGVAIYHSANHTKEERRSALMQQVARQIPASVHLTHGDSLMGLQFYRGTMQVHKSTAEICQLLNSGAATYVAVRRNDTWDDVRDCYDGPVFKLAEWTAERESEPFMRIYSNRESFPLSAAPNIQTLRPTDVKKHSTP